MVIVLLGYMGSGKTTIGQQLSVHTGIPFYDLDTIIMQNQQSTIPEIFEKKGELYFRKTEHHCLTNFIENVSTAILSLGGGTPCYYNTMPWLNEKGTQTIYLKASIKTLTQRLQSHTEQRPLIANISSENLEEYIAKHLFERTPYYTQAKHTILVDSQTTSNIVNTIIQTIGL